VPSPAPAKAAAPSPPPKESKKPIVTSTSKNTDAPVTKAAPNPSPLPETQDVPAAQAAERPAAQAAERPAAQAAERPAAEAVVPPAAPAAVAPEVVAAVKPAAPVAVAKPAATAPRAPEPPEPSIRPGAQRPMMPVRQPSKQENFVEGDHVVYPTHGVGKVERIATEEIAGHRLELIHITFEENRMTLRVPVAKARSAGLRKLATRKMFDEALAVLKGRARVKRTMWSRRAQEYEAKINSGDPIAIAEVVRDLHRNSGQPDQSFSERQIYEAALDRLAAELAALDQIDKNAAVLKLGDFLKAA